MFNYHIAFNLALLSLIGGTALLIWSSRETAFPKLARIIGYGAVVGALFSILCSMYYAVRYWEDGYFRSPSQGLASMNHCPMMGGPMMPGMMHGQQQKNMMNGSESSDGTNDSRSEKSNLE